MEKNKFINKARIVHGDKYKYDLIETAQIKSKQKIICPIHGIFEQRGDAHLSGSGCGRCGKSSLKTNEQFIIDANNVHNNKYDYSNVEYVNSKTVIKINCLIHGEFLQTPDNHLRGHGCPKCGFNIVGNSKKSTASEAFIDKAISVFGNKYDYSKTEYVDAKTKIKIICDKHGMFEQTPNDHLSGKSCLSCSLLETKPEIEIKNMLKNHKIAYVENERTILNGKEIDIYLPDYKIGIEYNGLYWHSNLFKEKKYHINKTNDCENNNIQLIQIFEDEWVNKKSIVESILKSKVGIFQNIYYARKCIIKKIDSKIASKFLKENHLQGNVGSNVKLGLFHEDNLVSIMTFGKKRIVMGNKKNNNGEYEMLRFCNKLNTQVVGGASKLLKYFIKFYKPELITTYADRRYSNGSLYLKLGFKHEYNTQPNYYYFKKNSLIREYRYKYRKNVLVNSGHDSAKTEHQIMNDAGFLKIYDSGNMKFTLKL